jgi:S-adenosylmethionine-diacylglycerol 3-amino-3-carboxypropyl transferase
MNNFLKFEFENRIFISLSIVAVIYTFSITIFQNSPSMLILIGSLLNLSASFSLVVGYSVLAGGMLVICVLRMWAGTILSSQTVMSFQVRSESLQRVGPYILVRNPIYLADLSAIFCFSVCMPLPAILMPVLFYLHYIQLIRYEEQSFSDTFSLEMEDYKKQTPRLFPTVFSLKNFLSAGDRLHINYDGLRHNALYLLFIPGYLVAAAEQNFLFAVLIGIPGVVDWAVIHTKIGLNKDKPEEKKRDTGTTKKSKVFEDILYAQCWEDPSIDRTAFNMKKDDVLFSITSGGCNVLTFLLDNPKKIIALDISPYQNHLLELKITCFKGFDYKNLLKFIGITPTDDREKMYDEIRGLLTGDARNYWDQNLEKINKGIMHCGRYEKYMRLLGRLLNILIGKKVIKQLFLTHKIEDRIDLYDQKWNNFRWKIFTKIMLSRKIMSLLFDKAFFAYLEDSFSFGDHFALKTEQAFKKLPVRESYFLTYILFGNYSIFALPDYLRPENFDTIRKRVSRIEIITDSCQNYFSSIKDNSISRFNYSNIFEWMSEIDFENLLKETIRVAKDGGIMTYRNLLVPREHPYFLSRSIRSLKRLAENLKSLDLSFIYNNYIVEKIEKEGLSWDMMSKSFQTIKN